MRQIMMALALLGALSTAAYAQAPATGAKTKAKATASAAKPAASHSVRGTVKSMDATSLTVTRSGKDKGDLMVMMNSSTQKDGPLAVGSTVSVRYKEENGQNIATAVKASPAPAAKPAAAAKKK